MVGKGKRVSTYVPKYVVERQARLHIKHSLMNQWMDEIIAWHKEEEVVAGCWIEACLFRVNIVLASTNLLRRRVGFCVSLNQPTHNI